MTFLFIYSGITRKAKLDEATMAFNLQTWRDQCKAYLKDLKQRIADRKVDSIYGAIAAAAVWPVIAAFQQGDLSALVALG